MTADPHSPALGDLVRALTALDYGRPLLMRTLGRSGWADAMAGSPGGALWHLHNGENAENTAERDVLITEAFFLREPVERQALEGVFGVELINDLTAAGVLAPENFEAVTSATASGQVRARVDIRPVSHDVHQRAGSEILVASDPDASLERTTPGEDHVPGVGQAPLTLLNQVPSGPVTRLLDLGTGSGILALTLDAEETVATDVHERALGFARASSRSLPGATGGGADGRIDWRAGNWFEPVTGESFDRIVSNPPFVVGPAIDAQVYRDSGLMLDDASRTVVQGAAAHLAPGGTAHVLGAWTTTLSESPSARVAGWLPDEGIRAWIIQRDDVPPSTYVRTWTQDASVDLRSVEGRRRTMRWLDYFAEHDITSIGMGYVHLQRIDGPSEVTFETVGTPDLGYFGDEVAEYFVRSDWLARQDSAAILASRFQVRPGLARETVELPVSSAGELELPGFQQEVIRLTRTDGPGFSHDVDAPLSAIIGGLSPVGLALGDVAELYSTVNDLDDDELAQALVPLVVDLVRHGMILPAELVDSGARA